MFQHARYLNYCSLIHSSTGSTCDISHRSAITRAAMPGRPHITWLNTIQQDLKQHHLTLPEAADLARNRPLWRMMSTYGTAQSWVVCQKRRRRRQSVSIDHLDVYIFHHAISAILFHNSVGKPWRTKLTSNAATSGGRSAVMSRDEGTVAGRCVLAPSAAWITPSAVAPGSVQDSNRRSSTSTSWLSRCSSFINSSNLTSQTAVNDVMWHQSAMTWLRLISNIHLKTFQTTVWKHCGPHISFQSSGLMQHRKCSSVARYLWVHVREWDAEGNGDLQTLICVLVARPRRCLTLSNLVLWQNWMAAYLGYTLQTRTLFCGWPIIVNDTHTRRGRSVTLLLNWVDYPTNRGTSGQHYIFAFSVL